MGLGTTQADEAAATRVDKRKNSLSRWSNDDSDEEQDQSERSSVPKRRRIQDDAFGASEVQAPQTINTLPLSELRHWTMQELYQGQYPNGLNDDEETRFENAQSKYIKMCICGQITDEDEVAFWCIDAFHKSRTREAGQSLEEVLSVALHELVQRLEVVDPVDPFEEAGRPRETLHPGSPTPETADNVMPQVDFEAAQPKAKGNNKCYGSNSQCGQRCFQSDSQPSGSI